jgi:hypothetical protein
VIIFTSDNEKPSALITHINVRKGRSCNENVRLWFGLPILMIHRSVNVCGDVTKVSGRAVVVEAIEIRPSAINAKPPC